MKMKVRLGRDENNRPHVLEIWRGRKKLEIEFSHSPTGDMNYIEITGRKELLPSFTEILQMVDHRRIDRIGTIELIELIQEITNIANIQSVDLIDKITLIDAITDIGTIDEISKIRDVTIPLYSLIVNANFASEFTGWNTSGGVSLVGSPVLYPPNSVKFNASQAGNLRQFFPIPIGADWMTTFIAIIRATATGNALKAQYYYTDGTNDVDTLSISVANTWERKTLTPTSGKYIEYLNVYHEPLMAMDTFLNCLLTVF